MQRQLKVHRHFCLLRGFQHFESQTMTCCCSLRLLFKVHAIKLNLQSQLHQVTLFSHYSSTELSKERLFLVKILQLAFQGLAPWRRHPLFCAQQSNTRNVFWEPGDDHNEPSSSPRLRWLFVSNRLSLIFGIHFIALSIIWRSLSLCITKISWSTINFKTENGSRLITKYYAFTICVDQVNFLREKFGVSAYSQDRLVAESVQILSSLWIFPCLFQKLKKTMLSIWDSETVWNV